MCRFLSRSHCEFIGHDPVLWSADAGDVQHLIPLRLNCRCTCTGANVNPLCPCHGVGSPGTSPIRRRMRVREAEAIIEVSREGGAA